METRMQSPKIYAEIIAGGHKFPLEKQLLANLNAIHIFGGGHGSSQQFTKDVLFPDFFLLAYIFF